MTVLTFTRNIHTDSICTFFSMFTVTNVPVLENTEIVLTKFNIKLFC